MPLDSGEIRATRLRMTPDLSRRWMRFQHGLCDSPTRCAICASERLASSWRSATIFLSIASMIQTPAKSCRRTVGPCARNLNRRSERQRFQAYRGTQPGAQRLGQGVAVAVDRPGIVGEPPIGALEPGESPAAGLADQRADDPAMDRDRPKSRLILGGEDEARGAGNELIGKAQHARSLEAGGSRQQWNGQPNMPACTADPSADGQRGRIFPSFRAGRRAPRAACPWPAPSDRPRAPRIRERRRLGLRTNADETGAQA